MINFSLLLVESEGGLFDFDATLPFMAIQIILLTVLLNIVFYGPITGILDQRSESIRTKLKEASEMLIKAEDLTKQYEVQLLEARQQSQEIILKSRKESQELVAVEIGQAQKNAEELIEETTKQLQIQKVQALSTLENQVDVLSDTITKKILKPQVVS
jgi:F-type H+-transporting ATPase subunit b